MGKVWRLILDKKGEGYYNMALDEALHLNYYQNNTPTLRIYGWAQPFISLGYNQKPQDVLTSKNTLPFVRRSTGGSAILHDQEITYSLVCSLEDLSLPKSVKDSYRIICSWLKRFYSCLGLEAHFAGDKIKGSYSKNKSLKLTQKTLGLYSNFCFLSYQHFDLLIKDKKIGGNAQRRKRNIIFQQGSIPQRLNFKMIRESIKQTEDLKQKTTCLDKVLGEKTKFSYLRSLLARSFKLSFGLKIKAKGIDFAERKQVNRLLADKYSLESWNAGRKN
ncbi:MAG: lipoate--protein ligase family protein [Omnitrophica bacterium]|nr:lipoate--protein ligase family protein [Candidatus Omnitrophota bacterium]